MTGRQWVEKKGIVIYFGLGGIPQDIPPTETGERLGAELATGGSGMVSLQSFYIYSCDKRGKLVLGTFIICNIFILRK